MIAETCGSLIIGGIAGTSLPPDFERALRAGQRAGCILFKRHTEGGPAQVASLIRAVHAATSHGEPPLVGVDQEGGRVARLGAPLLVIPPMKTIAAFGDVVFAERVARAVGAELAALGFTIDFAPVLDVNTFSANPIIGDRAFGEDPDTCARFGVAWTRGLQAAGLLACGKHFPGHGDTSKDSHVDLPVVDRAREHLDRVDLAPFRAAAQAGVASMMTAHVVYPALDPALPATLSPSTATLLREDVGFTGMLVTDDLGMAAITKRWSMEEAAVLALLAGCDSLLICPFGDEQDRALEAIVREAERSATFRARCEEAARRVRAARRSATARPLDDARIAEIIGGPESRDVSREIARRMDAGGVPAASP
ncbi:MAG: beta-N-acetylhexosaminidase [Myxococcales bacterium]|nr:beta-N-acetylhexosaminidase [Myxococcales bacterium]